MAKLAPEPAVLVVLVALVALVASVVLVVRGQDKFLRTPTN